MSILRNIKPCSVSATFAACVATVIDACRAPQVVVSIVAGPDSRLIRADANGPPPVRLRRCPNIRAAATRKSPRPRSRWPRIPRRRKTDFLTDRSAIRYESIHLAVGPALSQPISRALAPQSPRRKYCEPPCSRPAASHSWCRPGHPPSLLNQCSGL